MVSVSGVAAKSHSHKKKATPTEEEAANNMRKWLKICGSGFPATTTDGIDKYIFSCDANTSDLYTTAIPMDEIARIFIGRERHTLAS